MDFKFCHRPFAILASTAYGYDDASRLLTVGDGTHSATYDYLDNSSLVEQIVFATNGTTVMTTTKGYDFVNRLTNTTTLDVGLGTLDSHAYKYNPASQRTSVTNLDGSYWVYGYDSMGQVTSGKKYWSDSTPVAGQQFDYAFDDIGNRQTTTRDLRQASYSVNNLNQYASRTVPGFVNVLGTATNTATVSLWSQDNLALYTPTTRKGDYFRGEMLFNNNTGALWLTITNVAVLSNYTGADVVTNTIGKLFLPKTAEVFGYDADGNLTSDSLWTNVWNGENRRIVIERRSDAPSLSKVKEVWTILADGRWIERIVSTNNGTAYYPSLTNRYVWDNQVLLAVLDHTNGVVVSFLRGIDMSGSIQGAGGVGGVLAVKAGTSAQCGNMANTTHFTCYDGNGNVAALVNAATGIESARYECGPFAEQVRETGPMAKLNPIRFSTQYHDDYIGDDKYLFRDLRDGRWLSRDPIEERGGENLYEFVGNNPVDYIDPAGRKRYRMKFPSFYISAITFVPGDIIEVPKDTITVRSGNLWPFAPGSNLAKLRCLLAELGFNLPVPNNGVYLASFGSSANGWTVTYGIPTKAATFLSADNINGLSIVNAEFQIVTVWHEMEGHNKDDGEDGPAFDARYEKPVQDAVEKLKKQQICATCVPKNGAPSWTISNAFDKAMCKCGIDRPPKRK
ncbi:MAG: RHS repeat-associated core domain-containing protein [Verrucomicrobiae bacterium]|nr:RHS repeat-associated core domain-containing protein [Verrucomicrobiae bacterium]